MKSSLMLTAKDLTGCSFLQSIIHSISP